MGANAVWQKLIKFDRLELGQVSRSRKVLSMASGKGINVAIAMERLGSGQHSLIQTLGGREGKWIARDLDRFEFATFNHAIGEATRCCITLKEDSGRITELIEPSPVLSSQEWKSFSDLCHQQLAHKPERLLVCGSLPAGDDHLFFKHWPPSTPDLWVDSCDRRWLTTKPQLIKINNKELMSLSSAPSKLTRCEDIARRFAIEVIIVTHEQQDILLWEQGQAHLISPPKVDVLINSTGAGDVFFAALAIARDKKMNWNQSCSFAAKVASERCRHDLVENLPTSLSTEFST